MVRSTSLRLAVIYTAAFALSVLLLGAVTLATTHAALMSQFDARIAAEARLLEVELNGRSGSLENAVEEVRERERAPGALEYGLRDADGRLLEGSLAAAKAPDGWSTIRVTRGDEEGDLIRVYSIALPGGARLLIGDDLDPVEDLSGLILRRFGLALAGVVLLGALGGYGLSRDIHRRLAAMAGTAEAIAEGDLQRRVPVRGSNDDLDRLAETLNRMLDRIAALMESLRQVSNDIAHDLRTPLTRLRQRLEATLDGAREPDQREALEGAIGDLDAALDTFAALLRIAQIESGARRAAFRPVDLTEVAATVVEAFSPSAQDTGGSVSLKPGDPVVIEGDRELLTQMLANLVENSLRHSHETPIVTVCVDATGAGPVLSVRDNGPGVPEAERDRLFDRFYRLEQSRSTPGSGLGLALVAAVAKLHASRVALFDADPGLAVRVSFPGPNLTQPPSL